MNENISVNRAIRIGLVVINGPAMVILLGGMVLIAFLDVRLNIPGVITLILFFLVPFALAWLWWAIAAPRWRVWALERVCDRQELVSKATLGKIIWPPGHFFERTEIRSSDIREREQRVGWSHSYY